MHCVPEDFITSHGNDLAQESRPRLGDQSSPFALACNICLFWLLFRLSSCRYEEGLPVNWEWDGVENENCAVVFKVAEEFGGLSNMHNGYTLQVDGVKWGSSEALYQACRYPHEPEWQREIREAPHAMRAKMAAKKEGRRAQSRPDWDAVRVEIMRWCLREKLDQHFGEFYSLLRKSGDRAIVEKSRKDRFWGAVLEKDGVLRGQNRLGMLLMEIRDETVEWMNGDDDEAVWPEPAPPQIGQFVLCG